jgi:flavin reductase (DIM6/NTAB) family NADH-FMN oxidoreductase RutF
MNAPEFSFDTRAFRCALGQFATGIAVVTACGKDGLLAGLTVNSFASVSLDPPLVLWSLGSHSPALSLFRECTHYAINVLAADQTDVSQRFATSQADKFAGLEFSAGLGGAPVLPGCLASFECRNEAIHTGGDHIILIGHVERFTAGEGSPLLYFGGGYRKLASN